MGITTFDRRLRLSGSAYPAQEIVMDTVFRVAARLLVLLAFTLLAACAASGPKVTSDANPSLDLAQYRTFAFHSPLATDRGGSETALTKRLKQAARRNLESKGYVYAESNPDLLVNFFANIEAKQEVHSTASAPLGYGYYSYHGYSSGYYDGWASIHSSTENYRAGTLTIDLVDSGKKVVAWQGQVEGEIDPMQSKTPGQRVDQAVAGIIAKLPAQSGR
jgi:hypothetical protein